MAKPTILYIDDEKLFMSGVVDSLSDYYNVLESRTGDEGIDIVKSGEYEIALILLDIMLPEGQTVSTHDRGRTSGVEVVRILKELEFTIPIICYTGLNDREVHEQLVELGVHAVISKRTLPSDLQRIIQRVISDTSEE